MLLVMGSGSVGSLFGGQIALRGTKVILIGRTPHISAINEHGLQIKGKVNAQVPILGYDSIEKAKGKISNLSYVLITTKAQQTFIAANELLNIISPETIIIAIQNGIGTEKILSDIFTSNVVLRGVTSIGVSRPIAGIVEYLGKGKTFIGYSTDDEKLQAERFVNLLLHSGIDAKLDSNIIGSIYTKTIVNCALNPLAALYRVNNIDVYKQKNLRAKATLLAKEAWNVTKKLGIKLTVNDPIKYTFQVIKRTGKNINSMLTDIMNKRITEIDFLNGKIISQGIELGVDISNNKEIFDKIKAIEASFAINT